MLTDFKISRITRNDDGSVVVVARIYEGNETAENEYVSRGVVALVTRYRRTALLRTVTLTLPDLPLRASEAQIQTSLKAELAKDLTRTPIAECR